jgi:hypothetical protein
MVGSKSFGVLNEMAGEANWREDSRGFGGKQRGGMRKIEKLGAEFEWLGRYRGLLRN